MAAAWLWAATSGGSGVSLRDVSTLSGEAGSLAAEVAAERRRPLAERETRASDDDLDRAAAVLHAVMRPGRDHHGAALRGLLGRMVTDRWSFDSALSARLCSFDDRLGGRG